MSETLDRTIAPEVHSFGELILPPVSTRILPNGIVLSILDSGDMDVNRLTVAITGGEAEEPCPTMSKLAASLPVEGCKDMSGDEIAEIMEFNGAWIKSLTHTHHRSLTIYSLNSSATTVFPVVGKILSSPTFPGDAVENIVGQAAERLRVEQEKVAFKASRALKTIMYGADCPLSRQSSPEELVNIDSSMLSQFYYAGLNPAKIHAFLAGRITPRLLDLAVDTLMQIPVVGAGYEIAPLSFNPSSQRRVHVECPDAVQSAVKIAIPSVGRNHPDYIPLRMAVIALGGYFGSRLMLNIREDKGLTYGISSALVGFPDRSFISVSTQTDNQHVDAVIDEVINEMERMKDPSSYSDAEIDRLSRHVLSGLASVLDSPFTAMDMYEIRLFASTPADYFDRQQAIGRALSPEMLVDIAQRYFDISDIYIATAGRKM